MLPEVRPDTSKGVCDFVWLDAESYGPVDPTCGATSIVILVYGDIDYESHRCASHAAYDLSEDLCKQLGVKRTDVSREAFKSLCSFFESYIASRLPATTNAHIT